MFTFERKMETIIYTRHSLWCAVRGVPVHITFASQAPPTERFSRLVSSFPFVNDLIYLNPIFRDRFLQCQSMFYIVGSLAAMREALFSLLYLFCTVNLFVSSISVARKPQTIKKWTIQMVGYSPMKVWSQGELWWLFVFIPEWWLRRSVNGSSNRLYWSVLSSFYRISLHACVSIARNALYDCRKLSLK